MVISFFYKCTRTPSFLCALSGLGFPKCVCVSGGGAKVYTYFLCRHRSCCRHSGGNHCFFCFVLSCYGKPLRAFVFFLPLSWRLNSNIDDSDDAWELWREGLYVSVGINKGMFSTCEFF
ncbi:hypothetical protein, unlikely [Trypanosoma brucei gambiense DAL972]|uniref:Uncharacterized protein n=1 Tax=Trypanosoma brucei gambiense (strain MHOM/CI/86/DAL972) TaxID=679716 RepID=D0A087_TRYB9|nr:hypothetical protein, unlikely [Trypanosoma brucei gambiense DAL972]CBH16645.1 hypothetical protein, unlikely [Trypanosoma brucei gambiense DAL972]|eukprot:XP_011778909.1 hypothetical protein, unlikely [Trypanosoma brucei gambiense DAL972]